MQLTLTVIWCAHHITHVWSLYSTTGMHYVCYVFPRRDRLKFPIRVYNYSITYNWKRSFLETKLIDLIPEKNDRIDSTELNPPNYVLDRRVSAWQTESKKIKMNNANQSKVAHPCFVFIYLFLSFRPKYIKSFPVISRSRKFLKIFL